MGKRGPKKKPGKREANGQLSRKPAEREARHIDGLDREQQDTIAVAVEARQRVFGVPAPISRDQMAGSAIGRLCLQGLITRLQYDAAMSYAAEVESYGLAYRSPRQPGAVNLNATKGGAGDYENVALVQRIMADRDATNRAILDKQIEIGNFGNLKGALDTVVLRDVHLDHLLGDLRTALNALVKRYGLEAGRAAA